MAGFKVRRYSYRKTGLRAMAYHVTDVDTGQDLGTVYRDTGTTWAAADLAGRRTIDHYPGSRDVAASSLKKDRSPMDMSADRVELRTILEDHSSLSRNDADHLAGMIVAAGYGKK